MATEQERHLAAVMFTDIVGYTALMQEDEESARVIRERHREVVEGAITTHRGTLVQFFGDGTLSVFPSASEAVAAAVQLQEQLQTYPKIPLRVGIEVGEVAYDEQGAYGDAVNVASRIESLGSPGSVLVSEGVRAELKNQPGLKVVPLCEVGLKNVAEPVGIYAVAAPRLTLPKPEEIAARGLPVPRRPSGHPSLGFEPPRRGRRRALTAPIIGVLAGIGALALLTVMAGLWGGAEAAPRAVHVQRQVTFVGNVVEASVSPQGDFLAYTTRDAEGMTLMVQDLGGGSSIEIASGSSINRPNWSPDGQQILVGMKTTDYSHRAYPRLGGDPVSVSPFRHGLAQWSVDDRRVFVWGQEARIVIHTIGTDSSTPIRAADSTAWLNDLAPHPSGDALALLQNGRGERKSSIYRVAIDGVEGLASTPRNPPGHIIAGSSELLVEDPAQLASVKWSSTGDALYYLREDQSAYQLMRLRTTAGRAAANVSELLVSGLELSRPHGGLATSLLSITDDGTELFLVKGRAFSNLWSVRSRDNEWDVEALTTGTAINVTPSPSPDGHSVIYKSTVAGRTNVFIKPSAGGPSRQLTHVDSVSGYPVWSPDGESFAFGLRQNGGNHIATASVSGSGTPKVFTATSLSRNGTIEWAPGADILYQRSGVRNFHFLDPDTGEERPLLSPDSAATGFALRALYSPDGTQLVMLWNRGRNLAGLYLISLSDGVHTRLTTESGASPMGWSDDGRTVYALWPDRRDVVAVSTDGGDPTLVTTLPFEANWVGATLNDRWLLVAASGTTGDVWSIANDPVP